MPKPYEIPPNTAATVTAVNSTGGPRSGIFHRKVIQSIGNLQLVNFKDPPRIAVIGTPQPSAFGKFGTAIASRIVTTDLSADFLRAVRTIDNVFYYKLHEYPKRTHEMIFEGHPMRSILSSMRGFPNRLFVASLGIALVGVAHTTAIADTVTIQGSTTFNRGLLEPYRAGIEGMAGHRIEVVPNKSIHGLVALLEGRAKLAMISSTLDGELGILQHKYPKLDVKQLRCFEVARTRIAFAIHPTNAVRRVSLAEIAKILNGEFRSWRDVGGPDLPISVITTHPGGGVPTTVRAQLLDGKPLSPGKVIQVESAVHVVKIAAQIEGALGIAQLGLLGTANVAELQTDSRVEQELNLVTNGDPDAATAAIIQAIRQVAIEKLF